MEEINYGKLSFLFYGFFLIWWFYPQNNNIVGIIILILTLLFEFISLIYFLKKDYNNIKNNINITWLAIIPLIILGILLILGGTVFFTYCQLVSLCLEDFSPFLIIIGLPMLSIGVNLLKSSIKS